MTDFKTAIKGIMAARRSETDLPSPDELFSFRAGLLAAEETEELLERAAVSPRIAQALIDAGRFPGVEPTDERQRVTEKDLAAQWLRFEQRLHQESRPETAGASPARPARRLLSMLQGGRWLWSLTGGSLRFAQAAAALLLVGLGLSWLFMVRGPGGSAGPRLNLPIVELVPASESGERAAGEAVKVPANADGIFLVLTLRTRRSYPVYEARIDDGAGTEVWSSTALERAVEGYFTLTLARGFLSADRYRITLSGIDGDRRDRLAVYELPLEPSRE